MDWFKSYNGAPSDTKFPLIAHKSGLKVHQVALCWWVLMDHASQSKSRGDVSAFDCEASDFFFQFEDGTFEKALKAFTEKGMIVDGFIANWKTRQKNENAERQKKWREKKKLEEEAQNNALQTERNSNVTLRNERNALPEEKEEREEKEEKDIIHKEKIYKKEFDEFWKNYPKTRAGSKQKALTAFKNALKRSSFEDILNGVMRYAASREVADGYAKGAAAWLNDDRWTSDYTEPPPNGTGNRMVDALKKRSAGRML